MRYAVRRVRRLAPEVIVLVALLRDNGEGEEEPENIDVVRGSFRATVDKLFEFASDEAVPEKLLDRPISTDRSNPMRTVRSIPA